MVRVCIWPAIMAGLLLAVPVIEAAETMSSPAPTTIAPFSLTDVTGQTVAVAPTSTPQLTVVCFLGTECPLARKYGPRLNGLQREFQPRGVRFLGVNSNAQDTPAEVAQYAKDLGLTFPVLKDPANKIADQFAARHVTEVFVLDQTLAIRYHGRIDDQYQPGVSRTQPTRNDLQLALTELLAGKPVAVPRTESAGCLIGRVKTPTTNATVTFSGHIAKILNKHCVECHRPGEIGPFSLTDYTEITGWGPTIVETIDAGRMPPWNANPKIGHFRNARTMPDADKQLLRDWVAAGMPFGDKAELPEPPQYASGWQMPRPPDLVVKMRDRPFRVPDEGTVEYQYFVVNPHFDEDRWVSAAQVIPGSRATVHHCIVFVRPPDGADVRGVGYLTGYVPGQRSFSLPPGYARKVPAGSKFVFQMHYTPNGVAEDDLTQLGMTFIPEPEVTHEVLTMLGIDQEFEIPPHAADYAVQGRVNWFPKQAELLAIVPHMHVRGKAFQASSRQGTSAAPLLDVPRYDFNWQHVYELSQPMPLDGIDQLEFTARFDNSAKNPANPDPTQTVTWGDQTWEEMAIAFFEMAVPRNAPEEAEPPRSKQRLIVKMGAERTETESAETFVKDFFARFDRNRDDVVEEAETPLAFRKYAFPKYDDDQDGKLTRDEIHTAAKQSRRKR
jgi:peroxiredoxin/mono/diheme cytochrome c family protein